MLRTSTERFSNGSAAGYQYRPPSVCARPLQLLCSAVAELNACMQGLLQRRHARIAQIKYIGKESNSLEEVESGLIHSEQNVYTEYPDPRRDEWQTKIVPRAQGSAIGAFGELERPFWEYAH